MLSPSVENKLKLERILSDLLIDVDSESLIPLHNEVCYINNDYGNVIEHMNILGELFYGMSVLEFLDKYDLTDFNTNDKYFIIDDNYNLISFDYPDDYIEYDEISAMILDDYLFYINTTDIDEIKEFLQLYFDEIEQVYND